MICFKNNMPIHTVKGEFFNFKITTPYDMQVAEHIIGYVREHMD